MNTTTIIPISLREAGSELRRGFAAQLQQISKLDFLSAWFSIVDAFPGLQPDGYEESDSGWPRELRRFAAEACRRVEAGELADEELYLSDAQWVGLYDRMTD